MNAAPQGFVPDLQPLDAFERETLGIIDPSSAAGTDGYKTQFGAVPYRDRNAPRERRHEWLVKQVMTRGEQGMLVGASQAGKSFLALDLALAVARGVPWFGNKCKRGLVVYHAGESAKGVRDKRIPAYDKANGIADGEDLPFVLLTLPLDLYASDDDTAKMIAECRHWQARFPAYPLELLVIDTFSAATPGADENAGKDVGVIRRRCKRIEMELGCAVLLVHHKNAQGTKARGHTSMFADVENVLDVALVTTIVNKEPIPLKDVHGRKVRVAKITKLKDGGDEREFRFTLRGVTLGHDEDGDPVTSCVIEPPDMGDVEPSAHERAAPAGARLPKQRYTLLKSIEAAIEKNGRMPAPPDVPVPNNVPIVEWRYARDVFAAQWFGDEHQDDKKRDAALRTALSNGGTDLVARGYIKKHNNWVWRTGKRLPGDERRAEREQQHRADVDEGRAALAAEYAEAAGNSWIDDGAPHE